jgi:hypothetical protein
MVATLLAQAVPGVSRGSANVGVQTSNAILTSLSDLGSQLASFLPGLIAALVVFFVGWAIAVAAGRLVERLLVVLRINQAFEHLRGFKAVVERAGLRLNVSLLIGEIVKWFFILVTLLAATSILGLGEISSFLTSVLLYIPNVVVAALILIIAVVLSNFVYRTVQASITAAGFSSAPMVAAVSKWAIIVFAMLAALTQLNVAVTLIQTIVTAFFAMIALAGGLAFGLGGKDLATRWLKKFEADLTGRSRQ